MLTIKEVAKLFSVSRVTIWRWTKELHDFPRPMKIGRSVRWRERDIENYIQHRAEAAKDDA